MYGTPSMTMIDSVLIRSTNIFDHEDRLFLIKISQRDYLQEGEGDETVKINQDGVSQIKERCKIVVRLGDTNKYMLHN